MEQRKEYRECCGVTEVVYRRPVEEERMWKWLAWREVREEHHTRWRRIYDPTYVYTRAPLQQGVDQVLEQRGSTW